MIVMRYGVGILFADLPVLDPVGLAPGSRRADLSGPRNGRRKIFALDCASQFPCAVWREVRAPPRRRTGFPVQVPETPSKTLTRGLTHHGRSDGTLSLRATHEGQRMAYHIARLVSEQGLMRPVIPCFRCVSRRPSLNPLVAGRVR